ncbi:hypothetical protein [Actinomadura sp. HBU206391]|uniref:hypothetical protein n=1 Tax=Actinomadura sp. HBU206391 TaxID=2731692 RepID=UPI0016507DC2|nr:hypothetical protein [Actinomadura sp. HBU206391]MBC6460311.1 hypothetical protein [Actinomadura sp. HBU206391]
MDHELIGPRALDGRRNGSAAGGPFALLPFAIALVPVRPVWLWTVLIAAGNALPWLLGRILPRRPVPYWRLSAAGLERIGSSGEIAASYERDRIRELALTAEDGVLTVFHKFGATEAGELTGMGFEPLTFFLTARRLGIPIHVLDGDSSALKDDEAPPPGQGAEQRLLDQEAELLVAVHEPTEPRGAPVELESPRPLPGRARTTALGVLAAVLSMLMIIRIALEGAEGFTDRLTAGFWALTAGVALLLARRRLQRTTPVHWRITAESLRAGGHEVAAADIAALVVGPGVTAHPVTGEPEPDSLCVLAFDHRLRLLARLPARGLDKFQLAHALDEHGYRVITPDAQLLRPSEYGLDGLPEIFAQVPGGRLVVAEEGLGWADAAGDVVLRMPQDRIGGIELLTIGGHAWLRVYDADGDEFFAAPLTALRIARTDLRESARRAGLPVTDAEYDAYLSAAFHGTVSGLSVAPEARVPPAQAQPPAESSMLLDVPRRSRIWSYGVTAGVCEFVAVLGALWLGPDLGGFALTVAWAGPTGLLLGLVGAWLYDRNRSQLRVSTAGIMAVTPLGRIDWNLRRDAVGGVGLDESEEGTPKLVVWSPAGRVLRRVTFPPDLGKLRRACERYGLPWGPPDAGRPAPPPPEL